MFNDEQISFAKRIILNNPDLNSLQIGIICSCYFEELQISDLSNILQVTPPAISRSIDALEKMKLVKRQRQVVDRRCVKIKLTEKGKAILSQPKWEI
jgi:MarR family 2-MHQ and catechol resistance regulon transcriptional repressor